jgi:hypothetical protein
MKKIALVGAILLFSFSAKCQKIFSVDYESQADVKVFVVNYESQAGWRNSSQQHLMY